MTSLDVILKNCDVTHSEAEGGTRNLVGFTTSIKHKEEEKEEEEEEETFFRNKVPRIGNSRYFFHGFFCPMNEGPR